jgi:hypothetical protein
LGSLFYCNSEKVSVLCVKNADANKPLILTNAFKYIDLKVVFPQNKKFMTVEITNKMQTCNRIY